MVDHEIKKRCQENEKPGGEKPFDQDLVLQCGEKERHQAFRQGVHPKQAAGEAILNQADGGAHANAMVAAKLKAAVDDEDQR